MHSQYKLWKFCFGYGSKQVLYCRVWHSRLKILSRAMAKTDINMICASIYDFISEMEFFLCIHSSMFNILCVLYYTTRHDNEFVSWGEGIKRNDGLYTLCKLSNCVIIWFCISVHSYIIIPSLSLSLSLSSSLLLAGLGCCCWALVVYIEYLLRQ